MKHPPDLALYMYAGCPYCARVDAALHRLGVEVEHRDIHQDPAHRAALVGATGRGTVPVLRIEGDAARWMPESADIVRYLQGRFGGGSLPFSNPMLERLLLFGAVFVLVSGANAEGPRRWHLLGQGALLLAVSEAWRAWRWDRATAWATAAALALAGTLALLLR